MSNKIYPVDAIKHPSDKRADIPTTEHAGEEQFVIADSPKGCQVQGIQKRI